VIRQWAGGGDSGNQLAAFPHVNAKALPRSPNGPACKYTLKFKADCRTENQIDRGLTQLLPVTDQHTSANWT
jgi:hypothetical protein